MTIRWVIYCHTHTESSRRYIGLTKKTMRQRWNQHVLNSKSKVGKGCVHFWNAIRKYGKDAFSHEVLEICHDLEVANLAEECWIEFYETRNPEKGFNLSKGGGSKPHKIRKNPWNNSRFREAAMKRSQEMWKDPKLRSQHSKIVKQQWQDPQRKIRASLQTKEQRKNPDIAARTSESMKEVWKDPFFRLKYEVLWSNPLYRAKSSIGLEAFRSLQRSKTHCPQGHEYISENTYIGKKGDRNCRTCHRLKTRLRRMNRRVST